MATADDIPTDLALEIGDDLDPKKFMAAARHFFGLVESLTQVQDADHKIDWRIKVREGSNILAMQPHGYTTLDLADVYQRIELVSAELVGGDFKEIGLEDEALDHAKGLSDLTKSEGRPIPIKVWVRKKPFLFNPDLGELIREEQEGGYVDYGTIEGTLNAIQDSRGSLVLKIRDPLFDRPIRCFVSEIMLDDAMHAFRHRVEVAGDINYRRNGSPTSIQAQRMEKLPDDSELPSVEDVRGLLAG